MPTPAETDRLSIQAGTPVAEHRRAGYTSHDKAVSGHDVDHPR